MKSTDKVTIVLLLVTSSLLFNLYLGTVFNQYYYIGACFGIVLLLKILIGFPREKLLHTKDTMQQIFIYAFLYLIFTYLCGIFTGFFESSYNLTFKGIMINIIPVILLIIGEELLRYQILKKSNSKKIIPILLVTSFVLLDVLLKFRLYNYHQATELLKCLGTVILPSISRNILLSYVTLKGGYKPTILYRLIMELPIFILPIIPDLGDYIKAILEFAVPMFLLLRFNSLYTKEKISFIGNKRVIRIIRNTFIGIIIGVMVYFISGLFKYYALTIASGSMEPNIKIGDVLIIKKTNSDELSIFEKGDVLAHNYQGKTIVHRIISIEKENEKYIFQTKGDNNNGNDNYEITEEMVIGKAIFKIPYIGYPSVWLSYLLI